MKTIIRATVIAAGILAATAAQAANAIVTTNLNIRTGPGTRYPVITSVPNGAGVDVRGCTSGYNWCRIAYAGREGWAAANYLAWQQGGASPQSNNFGTTAAAIGIPLIAGVIIGSALNSGKDRYDRDDYYRPRPPRPPHYRPDYRPDYRPGYRPGPQRPPHWNRPGPARPPHWDRPGPSRPPHAGPRPPRPPHVGPGPARPPQWNRPGPGPRPGKTPPPRPPHHKK